MKKLNKNSQELKNLINDAHGIIRFSKHSNSIADTEELNTFLSSEKNPKIFFDQQSGVVSVHNNSMIGDHFSIILGKDRFNKDWAYASNF